MNLDKTIRMTGMMLALGAGLTQLACGTDAVDRETGGLPPATEEELAVEKKMEQGTLAEIQLAEEKIRFVEYEPGRVLVMHQVRTGGPVTRVAGEDEMTLDQIFRAYAPDREVPAALMDAMDRVDAADLKDASEASQAQPARDGERLLSPGNGALSGVEGKDPGHVESVSSALSSSIDAGWFTTNFCNTSGTDWAWCHVAATTGSFASWTAHRANSVTCGDTSAGARTNFFVSGSLKSTVIVGWGECWLTGAYHGPHGWFGVNLERPFKFVVQYAQWLGAPATVRFAGWMALEDQFLNAF
jgi:hypothetical protein